jgi:hypothetical protein
MNFNENPAMQFNNEEEVVGFNKTFLDFIKKRHLKEDGDILKNDLRNVDPLDITPEGRKLFTKIVTDFYYEDFMDLKENSLKFDETEVLELVEGVKRLRETNMEERKSESVEHLGAFLNGYLTTITSRIQMNNRLKK